jgi:hypothetical protein
MTKSIDQQAATALLGFANSVFYLIWAAHKSLVVLYALCAVVLLTVSTYLILEVRGQLIDEVHLFNLQNPDLAIKPTSILFLLIIILVSLSGTEERLKRR